MVQSPADPQLSKTIRALNCETRMQLIDLLCANPQGLTVVALIRLLGVHESTVTHHVRLLTRQGFLTHVESRYKLNGERLADFVAALVERWRPGVDVIEQADMPSVEMIREAISHSTRLRILRVLACPREVGLNVREVARLVGVSYSLTIFHLTVLENAGAVRSVRTWDARRSYVTDIALTVLHDELASQSDQ